MPDESKPTLEEAIAVIAAAGYAVAKPGQAPTADYEKWVKLGTLVLIAILSAFTATDLGRRPHGATPEQVEQAVEKKAPTADAVAAKVWEK